ncbi:hypothetical protein GCM10011571_11260 [Marinithermofilum abyssi]|uniref:Tetratricopeptide repeat protein n=1 Tax=Marinithermofilum abyssi TaxID=1571185 RepID=A0A8J2YCT6_9BACL|nr:tetratricopeptide repeat protein [Marinithermofilum abyssi]GGE11640.1 hypothetical protein GCM10011571_11260 [Marinithermofilum abyssi]
MFQQWLQQVKNQLNQIEEQYPHSSEEDRSHLREEFQQLTSACDEILSAWSEVEEAIARMLHHFPDLAMEEEEVGEEFWLDSSLVRTFREGQGYYQLMMFREAKPFFHQVVEEEPEFLLGRVYLALSHFQEKQMDDAHRHFRLVADTAESDYFVAFAYHMMGCVKVMMEQDERAIPHFEKSLSLIPENPDGWFNLGACHYRLKDYHEAVPFFYRSLLLNPDDWESMYYLSCCFQQTKQWESLAYWRQAVYQKTNSPSIMECIAHDCEDAGDPEQALHWYRKLAARDPKRISVYHGMGWNLWAAGKREEAYLWLKKGLALDPNHPDLLFAFLWFTMQDGQMDEAKKLLKKIPTTLLNHPLWWVIQSRLSAFQGDYSGAKEAAQRVIQHRDSGLARSLGHYQLGRVLLEMGEYEQALQHFREAQSCCPQWKEPLFYEGLCHFFKGEPDVTRKCWEQIPLNQD